MHFTYGTVASMAFAFATLGNGHLIMKTPVPFGVSTLNNSPLVDAKPGTSTSDYPCKQRTGVYDITKMNNIAVGTPQELSFEGSASHGGGTCQIAVTKDKEPTANSTFKIVQVFEGGCPIDSDGNGGTHPFTFTLPKGFPNGVLTLAWLWYNRIGNRELYMNCAPITVSGGSDSDDVFDSLPNIYLINMPTSECESTFQSESNAVTIPHPGQYILKQTSNQEMHVATGAGCAAAAAAQIAGVNGYKAAPVITTNGAAYQAPGGAGGAPVPSGSGSPSGAPSGAPSSAAGGMSSAAGSAAPSAPAGSGAPSAPAGSGSPSSAAGGSVAPSAAPSGSGLVSMSIAPSGGSAAPSAPAGSASAPSAAPSGAVPSAAPSAAPSGAVPSAAPSAAAPSGAAPSGGACSTSGMACSSDGKQFGVCSNGLMVWRAVAPGTTCSGGQITRRSEFRNVHVRRHIQRSNHWVM